MEEETAMDTFKHPLRGQLSPPAICLVAILGLALSLISAVEGLAAPVAPDQNRSLSVPVLPGDSWSVIRARMFSVEALKRANPEIARQGLQPGDIVRSPYVPVDRLDSADARHIETERQLEEARSSQLAMKQRVLSLQAIERQLADERDAGALARTISYALLTTAILLAAAFLVAFYFMHASRRYARLAAGQLAGTDKRYTELKGSLRTIEIDLQRRMVNLLRLHGARVVSQGEVDTTLAPLLNLAPELRKKHAR